MAVDTAYQEAVRRIDRARQDGVTELYLSGMGLTEVPSVLGQLTGLQVLDLWRNQISSIPSVLGQLTGLQELKLSRNQISSIPSVLGQLRRLRQLDLDSNQISSIPSVLGQLRRLEILSLDNNPLNPQFATAYSQGTDVLLQYLRSIAPDPARSKEAKR